MESEKVKEIKDKLQEEIFITNSFGDKLRKVPTKELENLLTLINELESENERLMKLQARGGCRVAELGIENQQLKDRIAELENTDYYKEIEKKKEDLLCKEYSLIKYEKEIAGKYLKEFAEKVKEKALLHCKTINCYELKFIEETIDELLEEYDKWNIII